MSARTNLQARASGLTAAQESSVEDAKEAEAIDEEPLGQNPRSKFRTPGFQRMRTDWRSEDAPIVTMMTLDAERAVVDAFSDAYRLMNELWDTVREPEVDARTGEIRLDERGWRVWRRNPLGHYIEDYSLLTRRHREDLLFSLTTRQFGWRQTAADLWGEAMLARSVWDERYAIDFDAPLDGTVDDRKAAGNKGAAEERYFAVYKALVSRKAEALVRSLETLAQRLKDTWDW